MPRQATAIPKGIASGAKFCSASPLAAVIRDVPNDRHASPRQVRLDLSAITLACARIGKIWPQSAGSKRMIGETAAMLQSIC
jgi:hypothetical protein